jgi:excisionase family DNA binding protein
LTARLALSPQLPTTEPASVPAGSTEVLPRALYRPIEAARALSLSRSVVFDLLRTGRLRSVKEGRLRLIPASAIRDYINLLEREAA